MTALKLELLLEFVRKGTEQLEKATYLTPTSRSCLFERFMHIPISSSPVDETERALSYLYNFTFYTPFSHPTPELEKMFNLLCDLSEDLSSIT